MPNVPYEVTFPTVASDMAPLDGKGFARLDGPLRVLSTRSFTRIRLVRGSRSIHTE